MSKFVLIILVTFSFGNEPSSFQIRLPKETYKKCMQDSEIYEFPFKKLHKVISVKTRCEKVVGNPKQLNRGKSI